VPRRAAGPAAPGHPAGAMLGGAGCQPPRFLPLQISGTIRTGALTRAAAAPRNGPRGRACRRRRTSRCDRRRPGTILPTQMGPQAVTLPARDDAGRGDGARSALPQPLSVPAPTPHARGSGAGMPRRLLSKASEPLSPRLAGLGDPPGCGQGVRSAESPSLLWKDKRSCPIPTPELLHRTPVPEPAPRTLCPTPQLAGAFDFPLQEGRRVASWGRSRPCASPPASRSPSRPRVLLGCRAERHGLRLLSGEEPAARAHPGHCPYPGAGRGAILH